MNNQHGFSAIIVVVLIVLFSLIGAYMATMSSVSSVTSASTGASIGAWFAAGSGVEWGIHQALNSGGCPGTNNLTINGYNVNVTCPAPAVVTENPDTYNIYTINVTATRGTPGQETFVSRSINVKVTDAP